MTEPNLDDKAALTTGAGWWHTAELPDAGIPAVRMSDGPHGLRVQTESEADHLGAHASAPATCFPPAVTLASAWDVDLAARTARALALECLSHGVHVLLGPGVNIKRSPLCGRNFEYFSEDPLLSGVLGTAWVRALQEQGVGASVKHFAANNQETARMTVSADIDARALREIYLPAFRRVVTQARPWTVMCSYNRINGVHASQDPWLLTDVLRGEWGFDGLVVSDWGAVVDRVKAIAAGLDLEMPSSSGAGPARVAAAVRAGDLDERIVERAAARVAELARKSAGHARPDAAFDADEHHALAREVAARGAVLLKNDGELLPLDPSSAQRIAVLGEFARTPRYQGAGSSKVNPTRLDDALTAITAAAPAADVVFAPGFPVDADADAAALRREAVATAADADVVLLFLGLPPSFESEGFDREHLELPTEQTDLLAEVTAANPRVAVVLANGGVVRLSAWIDSVPAVLEGWLGGQAGGSATADLLFGAANPSGRLTETIPLRLADTPAHLNWPGDHDHVRYGEGIFVGYRYYDARETEVGFPFGHGLSYTTFDYANLRTSAADGIEVTASITNSGTRPGHEVVQVYLAAPGSRVARPVRELKGFASVALAPGETRDVTIHVPREDLAYYDTATSSWVVEGLDYLVEVGASSRDIRLSAQLPVEGDHYAPGLTADSTLGQWLAHPVGGPLITALMNEISAGMGASFPEQGTSRWRGMFHMRLSQLAHFPVVPVTHDDLEKLLTALHG